ncbi:hypothetical protein Aph02nite_73340 [Actinoplanes philippinensis]|uniref:Membrane domain of glycerophosphoryl diester phosphodiesterase n=1 Tax=Actinoplanes philippinensis TaxID=35752 RepID=A0A1I2N3W2_9ACTN|nr:hypothetical protein [Actinoplanes philippinensis]GIE81384.1 hypothetical protein Aph02nite_73340 [Actinoplanes philippinensis]SFF96081.1 hypothetical protein SAMN05421541_13526 [Actinoplanes philippinensis]
MNEGWTERDGNGHYWPGQPPALPPAYYATPADPLVSPDYEGWWRRGFALIRRTWPQVLAVQALAAVPTSLLTVPAALRLTEEAAALRITPGRLPDMGRYLRAALEMSALSIVASLISAAAVAVSIQLVILAATGRPVSIAAAFRAGIRRAPAVIGWSFLAAFVYVGAALACFLPIIYVGAALMVLPVVVTLEPGAGIGRTFTLFHADLGTSISRVATMAGLGLAGIIAFAIAGGILEAVIGGSAGALVSALSSGVAGAAVGIVTPSLLVTAYADMRARREPFSTAYLTPAA